MTFREWTEQADQLAQALRDLLEDSPYVSDETECECGEWNDPDADDLHRVPCVHMRAHIALKRFEEGRS